MASSDLSYKGEPAQECVAGAAYTAVIELIASINNQPYDRESIPQEQLDLANKFRTSLFPWRGQFSPELIELFLERYSHETSIILDPFVGSGTTLFEASRKGLACYAAEINPSAIEMAATVHFANIALVERRRYMQEAEALAEKYLSPFIRDLFSYQSQETQLYQEGSVSIEQSVQAMMQEVANKPLIHNLLVNALIRYMNDRASRSGHGFMRALREHTKIVESLPYNPRECHIFHADARALPLPAKSIDLIITSPPYINVFNYHQNNRPAMELMHWNLLDIARSEIGSNRKHRQNRFLTVVQYALDMLDTLKEMHRLLRPDGRAIIVIGRESSIRGLSFKNGMLVAALASGGSGFRLAMLQERKFTNKFGEKIYEDILHLVPDSAAPFADDHFARLIAIWYLSEVSRIANKQVSGEVLEAKARADMVQKSPLFHNLASPAALPSCTLNKELS